MDAMTPQQDPPAPEGAVLHAQLELKAIPWHGRRRVWGWVEALGLKIHPRQKWACAMTGELHVGIRTSGTRAECETLLETLPRLLLQATRKGPLQDVQMRLLGIEASGKLPTLLWGHIPTP